MRKKRFTSLLCAALCLAMLAAVTVVPVSAAGGSSCQGNHSWDSGKWEQVYDCTIENAIIFVRKCQNCDAEMHIAFRSPEGGSYKTLKDASHSYIIREYQSDCFDHPTVEQYCTVCHNTVITPGGHEWEQGEEIVWERPCVNGTRTDTCKYCHTTKEVKFYAKDQHTWGPVEVQDATCTEPGMSYQECTVCGAKKANTTIPALGHRWVPDEEGSGQHCERCGVPREDAPSEHHIWSGWRSNATEHWLICLDCQLKDGQAPHTDSDGDYKCDVCGYALPKPEPEPEPVCNHEWFVTRKLVTENPGIKNSGTMNHYKVCSKCDETRLVNCAANGEYLDRVYCTDPTYCVCGNIVAEGQKNHNFGTWICHDESHEHKCLNRDCQYGTVEHHNIVVVDGVTKCSVCNYVIKTQSAPHVHSFGAWTVGTDGCVAYCADPTCAETKTSAHVPGAADCAGNAVCENCGAKVTTTPSDVHGPLEVRNAKAAEVGVEGYTGDTWCLTCGELIETGHAIEALKPSHEHSYTVKHDAVSHWQECVCGDRQSEETHSFVGGVCSCGEKEPARQEVHVHSFSSAFKSDSACHWHECTSCGEELEREEHLFINGKCACGLTYGNYEAMVELQDQKNSVVNVFTDVKAEGFYTLSVQRMYNARLMSGKASDVFDVNGTANRKEFMSVLARLNKVPGSNEPATWDTASVAWCVEKGYALLGDINARITREEIVTILWKMADKPTVECDLGKFTDSASIAPEAVQAMKWAVANGIMYGRGDAIQPQSDANRGEIATFVARYIDLMGIDEKA